MRIIIVLIALFIANSAIFAQQKISLEQCQKSAMENYPAFKQKGLLVKSNEIKQDNISNNWYPKLDFNAQATYQSEVTKVDVNMPDIIIPGSGVKFEIPPIDIPSPYKDQYKFTLDINQMIYDGGIYSAQAKVENASLAMSEQAIEVELYQLKEKINQFYFLSLLMQENLKLIEIMRININERVKVVESGIRNGVALQSNHDYLNAELLKLEQKRTELELNKNMALKSLSLLSKISISGTEELIYPNYKINSGEFNRPEYKLFESQKELAESTNSIAESKRLPKVFAFAQTGYGRPGMNMLSNEFEPFYFVGIKLNWNIWDWNTTNNDIQYSQIQKQIIETKKESFTENINIALEKETNEINKLIILIDTDSKIIELKSKITKTSASKLDNGVITPADYIFDLNEEVQAKINLETRKIQLQQSIINYNTLKGN
jgi:outer membrane protein TolC